MLQSLRVVSGFLTVSETTKPILKMTSNCWITEEAHDEGDALYQTLCQKLLHRALRILTEQQREEWIYLWRAGSSGVIVNTILVCPLAGLSCCDSIQGVLVLTALGGLHVFTDPYARFWMA